MWAVCFVLLLVPSQSLSQACKKHEDCGEASPCCSSYGFCGEGEGFCAPGIFKGAVSVDNGGIEGSEGCVMEGVKLIGRDLGVEEGGGGVNEEDRADCYQRCKGALRCRWYTYDKKAGLCYLKYGRGYQRNRTTSGLVSGSVVPYGCDTDPPCDPPYSYFDSQCLFYGSLVDVRRGFDGAREFCEGVGGVLPYFLSGAPLPSLEDAWHWINYPKQGKACWAGRRGRVQEDARLFPCMEQIKFFCARKRAFPLPAPEDLPGRWTRPARTVAGTSFSRSPANFGMRRNRWPGPRKYIGTNLFLDIIERTTFPYF